MKIVSDKSRIVGSPKLKEAAEHLYGRYCGAVTDRYSKLYESHAEHFSREGAFFSSPGRIEVCGNHTDHNRGKVLTAAISVDTLAFVGATADGTVRISSCGYPVFSLELSDLEVNPAERGTSIALVRGVAAWFVKHGFKVGGFSATMTSDVFKGAGVSSSASFEVLIAEVFNVLYNGGAVTKMQKAFASQYAENMYFGKPCGLLDQSAIALGGVSEIDFRDVENPDVESFEWSFSDSTDIFIVNTGGDHSDLTDSYASIRYEMESVAKCFGALALREVPEGEFYGRLPELQKRVSGRALLRAIHFFDENKRVERAAGYVRNGDFDGFARVINESGDSSYKLLQNCYAETDKAQRIPVALALAKRQKGVSAVRVHGGGFMGTILAFVEKECSKSFSDSLSSVFGVDNVFKLTIRDFGATYVEI